MARINKMAPKYVKRCGLFLFLGAIGMFAQMWTREDDHLGYPGRALLETRVCNGDTILPLIPYENTWDINKRAILYLLFLGWLFLGVAISADCFMAAIEVITAQTKKITVRGQEVEVEVWNSTVANLTLMALGSSAPEILLAVVETISLKFEAGDLGPGTIVGSAAFNLLFITAICISALPFKKNEDGSEDETMMDTRKIEEFGVFVITAVTSLWAYFWMVIVLAWWTAEEVTILEALITILMFPVLVWVCWAEDNAWWGYFSSDQVTPEGEENEPHAHRPRLKSVSGADGVVRRVSQAAAALEAKGDHDPEQIASELAKMEMKKKKKSRLAYRIQATRKMTGGKRVLPAGNKTPNQSEMEEETAPITTVCIDFAMDLVEVPESCGTAQIVVKRSGAMLDKSVTVDFDTSDGDAKAGTEYVAAQGTLTFGPNELEKTIPITVIDDNEWAPDKPFYCRLFGAKAEGKEEDVTLGVSNCRIMILNDDDPGTVGFPDVTMTCHTNSKTVKLKVVRKDGDDGNVLCFVKTISGTAIAGTHFKPIEEAEAAPPEGETESIPANEIHFIHQQREAVIEVELIPGSDLTNKTFTVEITSLEPEGCKMGAVTKCTVILSDDQEYKDLMQQVVKLMDEEVGDYQIGTSSWGEQFHAAMNMGADDGEPEWPDYLLHFLSFYWKVLHAFVPPTDYWGGWGTFWVSLGMIGAITCLVGDCAKMLGCVIGLDDSITAITFVALGTSLPDTFASMEATVSDDTADAAITNVTGSNSVNVFLGLGLPWCMAVFYHEAKGTKFYYPAGDLVFSVLVFFAFAVVCIILLVFRRFQYDCELGGPTRPAYIHSAFLAGSWVMYVVISSLKTKKHI